MTTQPWPTKDERGNHRSNHEVMNLSMGGNDDDDPNKMSCVWTQRSVVDAP